MARFVRHKKTLLAILSAVMGLGLFSEVLTIEEHIKRFEIYASRERQKRDAIKVFDRLRSQYPELREYEEYKEKIDALEDQAAAIYTQPNMSSYDSGFVEQYIVDHQDSKLIPDLLKKVEKHTIGERSLEIVLQQRTESQELTVPLLQTVGKHYLESGGYEGPVAELFLSLLETYPDARNLSQLLKSLDQLFQRDASPSQGQILLSCAEFYESPAVWQPELAMELYWNCLDSGELPLSKDLFQERMDALEERMALKDWAMDLQRDYEPAEPESGSPATSSRPEIDFLTRSLDFDRIENHIRVLSSLPSRIPGQPGCELAAQYVEDELRKSGLNVLPSQGFQVTVPVDKGARLQLPDGSRIELFCYWPNLVRTSTVPTGGISLDLVYGQKGRLEDFEGRDVDGTAILLDFDCGTAWLQAVNLGAKAILFIEPQVALRQEAERKYVSVPLDIPRFWIGREDGLRLKDALGQHGRLSVRLEARMDWESVSTRNIVARIDPPDHVDAAVRDQRLILSAYYDSISAVPSLAPGASSSCGIALFLEMARLLTLHPPARTVLLVATSGHFTGMAGAGVLTRAVDDVLTGNAPRRDHQLRTEIQELSGQLRTVEALITQFGDRPDLVRTRNDLQGDINGKQGQLDDLSNKMELIRRLPREDDLSIYHQERGILKNAFRDYGKQPRLTSILEKNRARYARQRRLWRKKPRTERRRLEKSREQVNTLFVGLDIYPESGKVGLFARGSYEDNRDIYRQRDYAVMARQLRTPSAEICQALGIHPSEVFADTINAVDGKEPDSFFTELFAFESEICSFAFPAVTLSTCNDSRIWVDTPHDTLDLWEERHWKNVEQQARFVWGLFHHMAVEPSLKLPKSEWRRLFGAIGGRAVYFEPSSAFVPDTPVPNAIMVLRQDWGRRGSSLRGFPKPLYGIHPEVYTKSAAEGDMGIYSFDTVVWPHNTRVDGFRLHDHTGEISFAPDLGLNGNRRYNFMEFHASWKQGTSGKYVLFPCQATSFTDLVDPRYLLGLQYVHVIDAATQNPPVFFGFSTPLATRYETSYVEPCVTIYTKPETRSKLTMSLGLVGRRFILINASEAEPEGEGYDLAGVSIMRHPNFEVARDVWLLNKHRNDLLEKHGIVSDRIQSMQGRAEELLRDAERYREEKRWAEFANASDRAWAFASRVYPDILSTANDTVKGVIFYLALVLPFSFFLERILFSFADIRKRIMGTVGIFSVVLILLGLVHPAFEITLTPFLIFLAFAILSLGILVTAILLGKFSNELRELRGGMVGVHHTDVNRFSAAFAAFNLGVSYMRRRKAKTILTCSTLIFLTFTVLSFTSLKSFVRFNKYVLPWSPPYEGLLYRNLDWSPLEEPEVLRFVSELGDQFTIAKRGWLMTFRPEEFINMEIESYKEDYATALVEAVVGMLPEEALVTGIDKTILSGWGRWLQDADWSVCIISKPMADALGIQQEDVGTTQLKLFGRHLTVVGVLDEKRFSRLYDLNDEKSQLTPISLRLSRPVVRQRNEELDPNQIANEKFEYMSPNGVVFVPFDFLMEQGGTIRSIAAVPSQDFLSQSQRDRTDSDEGKPQMERYLEEIMRGWSVIVYAGLEDRVYLYSSVGRSGLQGMTNVLVPMIIAGLIVLNTMLGSVFEREREIHTYSSVGLSPVHISSLFIAESCVYAVIGSITGYLLGQVVAKIITMPFFSEQFQLTGITLNYSSTSAVFSVFMVMVVTVLSTLYPAKRAHQLAVPDIERTWQVTEPTGEDWFLEMPFIVQRDLAAACGIYFKEFFELHTEESVGNFSARNVVMSGKNEDYECALTFHCWLAPYDFGVSQTVRLLICESGIEQDLLTFRLEIHRLSGDVASWKRTNRLFLNTLRKCFLIWRVMKQEDRAHYNEEAHTWLSKGS